MESKRKVGFFLIGIILLLFLVVVFTSLTNTFTHKIEYCYDRSDIPLNKTPRLHYSTHEDSILINYDFHQRCYDSLKFNYSVTNDIVDLYFMPKAMKEDCFCDTNFHGTLNSLDKGTYIFRFHRITDTDSYIATEEQIELK